MSMIAGHLRASNDNHPFDASFEKIPERFLRTYQNELFGWAKTLTQGNLCTIDLLNPPDVTVISSNWQGRATLQCDAYGDPVTKKMRFVIHPQTEEDERRIAQHCEALPGIFAAHEAAAKAKSHGRPKVARWVFDGTVPEYFQLRYQDELRAWAHNLKKIGTKKHIILREGNQSDLSPDPELGAVLIQVELKCRIERVRGDEFEIVVSAADEEQQRRIFKHCEKLQGAGIPPGMVLVEPERPGMPFMPTIGSA